MIHENIIDNNFEFYLVSCFDKDPMRNILKKWNGVNTINGVFSGEFQLSDVPIFGEWKISAAITDQVSFQHCSSNIHGNV